MAAILHGFILLTCAMAIPKVLNLIPLSSLAAILFLVGYKLAKPTIFKEMYRQGFDSFAAFMVTILGIVFTDLLIGIGLGLVVAVIFVLYNNYKKPFFFETDDHINDKVIRLELAEDVTFLNKANIQRALNRIPDGSTVIIDATRTVNIHQDVMDIIDDFKKHAEYSDISYEFLERKQDGVKGSTIKKFEESMKKVKDKMEVDYSDN
jgi:MFS superfamily sulfate permease-like transporter